MPSPDPSPSSRRWSRDRLIAVMLLFAMAPILYVLMAAVRLTHGKVFYRCRGVGATGVRETLTVFDLTTPRSRGARALSSFLSKSGLESLPMLLSVATGVASLPTVYEQHGTLYGLRRREDRLAKLRGLEKAQRRIGNRESGSVEACTRDAKKAGAAILDWAKAEGRAMYPGAPPPERICDFGALVFTEISERINVDKIDALSDLSELLELSELVELAYGLRDERPSTITPILAIATDRDRQAGDDFYNEIIASRGGDGKLQLTIRRRVNLRHTVFQQRHGGRVYELMKRQHRGARQRSSRGRALRTRGSRRVASRSAGGGSSGDDPPSEPDPARRRGLLGETQLHRAVPA